MAGFSSIFYGILGISLIFLGIPACIWVALLIRNRLLARETLSSLSYALGALATVMAPLLLIEGAVVLQAFFVYDGTCYGFTDGHWPCARRDFILADASYGLFLLIPVAALYAPTTLVLFILGWWRRRPGASKA